MNGFVKALLVTACGVASSIGTAVLLVFLDQRFDFGIYDYFVWFVIPVGAIGAGLAAASGYWAGARIFHVRPAKLLALQMLLVAGATHVLIHWLQYRSLVVDGTQVSDRIDFAEYLKIVLTSAHYQIGHSSSSDAGEVGRLGYFIGAVQFLGFLVGGGVIVATLRGRPWCARCEKYLGRLAKVEQRHESGGAAASAASALFALPLGGVEFVAGCRAEPAPKGKPANGTGRLTLSLLQCPACRVQWIRTQLHQFNGREWKDVEGGRLVEASRGLDLRPAFGESPGAPRRAVG